MENDGSNSKTIRIPILVAVNSDEEHAAVDYSEDGRYGFDDALDHVTGDVDGVRAIYQLWLEVPLPALPQYELKAPPLEQSPMTLLELKPLSNAEEGNG